MPPKVWESAPPPTHIRDRCPKKNIFFTPSLGRLALGHSPIGPCRFQTKHIISITIPWSSSILLSLKSHQGEALEHVLDVTADSPHGGDLLLLSKPLLNLRRWDIKLFWWSFTMEGLNAILFTYSSSAPWWSFCQACRCRLPDAWTPEYEEKRRKSLISKAHDFRHTDSFLHFTLVRVPLAPFTVTALAFTEASMPSGTSISSKELISFMTSATKDDLVSKQYGPHKLNRSTECVEYDCMMYKYMYNVHVVKELKKN